MPVTVEETDRLRAVFEGKELVEQPTIYDDLLKFADLPKDKDDVLAIVTRKERLAALKSLQKNNDIDLGPFEISISMGGKKKDKEIINIGNQEAFTQFVHEMEEVRGMVLEDEQSPTESNFPVLESMGVKVRDLVAAGKEKLKPYSTESTDNVDVEAGSSKDVEPVQQTPEPVAKETTTVVVPETKNDEILVWYPGILDDLKIVTYIDKEVSEDEKASRGKVFGRLRSKGIKLPRISWNQKDIEGHNNRQKVRSAAEFLRDPNRTEFRENGIQQVWNTRDEAIAYLKSLGIGDGKGVSALPDSEEVNRAKTKEAEKKKYVWYKGIIDHLSRATSPEPDKEGEKEGWKKSRDEAIDALRAAKVRLPDFIPTDSDDDPTKYRKDTERAKVYSALLAFRKDHKWSDQDRWSSRDAALEYLKNELGVGSEGQSKREKPVLQEDNSNVKMDEKIDFQQNNEFANLPLKEGETLRETPGLKYALKLFFNPAYRSSNEFSDLKRYLEDKGIDTDKLLKI